MDNNVAVFKANVTTNGKVFKNSRDHFTRSANAVGYILLSQLLFDIKFFIALSSEAIKHLGYSPVDILQGQAFNFFSKRANSPRDISY